MRNVIGVMFVGIGYVNGWVARHKKCVTVSFWETISKVWEVADNDLGQFVLGS